MKRETGKKIFSMTINLALFIIVLRVGWQYYENYNFNQELVGRKVPIMQLQDLQGNPENLSSQNLSGRAVLFWATWCGPCRVELNRIQSATEKGDISKEDVVTIVANESVGLVRQVAEDRGYQFPILVDESGVSAQMMGLRATPSVYFIGESGKIASVNTGITPFLVSKIQDQ